MNRYLSSVLKNKYILISLFLIFILELPYFILRQGVYIPSWDNLNSNVVWYKSLVESGQLFGHWNSNIPNFFEGIPRNLFGSEFSVVALLLYFFGTFKAYMFCDIIARIIGFFGMYLLLKTHVLQKNDDEVILCAGACTFALLPFWSSFSLLTIFGVPLLLYAFSNIRNKNYKFYNWCILTFIHLFWYFSLITPFFIIVVGAIWLYDVIKFKRINPIFILSIVYFTVIALLIEYRLILVSFFTPGFVSHRTEFNLLNLYKTSNSLYPFFQSMKLGVDQILFGNGQEHSLSMSQIFILPSAIFAIILSLIKKNFPKTIVFLLVFIALTGVLFGLDTHWAPFIFAKGYFPILKQFAINRFYFFNPTLWYIVFALSLTLIVEYINKAGKYIAYSLIVLQIILLFATNYTFTNSIKYLYHGENTNPSYKQYFAQNQFKEIKEFINKPQNEYKVLSLALPSAIASYNGFYTLDGYFVMYPLDYKHKFRTIIEKEFEKDPMRKSVYDDWGNIVSVSEKNLIDFELNTAAIKTLGGEYIFSAGEIKNSLNNKLKLLKIFKNKESIYTVYLYKIL